MEPTKFIITYTDELIVPNNGKQPFFIEQHSGGGRGKQGHCGRLNKILLLTFEIN